MLTFFLWLVFFFTLQSLVNMLVAKAYRVGVERFTLFADPFFTLFQRRIGETEYVVGWLPVTCSVKITGMVPPEVEEPTAPNARDLYARPLFQRFIIAFSGPLAVILFAAAAWGFAGAEVAPLLPFLGGLVGITVLVALLSKRALLPSRLLQFTVFISYGLALMGLTWLYEDYFPTVEVLRELLVGDIGNYILPGDLRFSDPGVLPATMGAVLGLLNLLPFPGMVGYILPDTVAQALTGYGVSERYRDSFGIVGFLLYIGLYGFIIYRLVGLA